MGRKRVAIQKVWEGAAFVARFRHPLIDRVVRWRLEADPETAEKTLGWLNSIFLHPEHWRDPPAKMPEAIRRRWLGEDAAAPWQDADGDAHLVIAGAEIAAKTYQRLYEQAEAKAAHYKKLLVRVHQQRVRDGPCPTLAEALATWLQHFTPGDATYRYNVERDLIRFRDAMGGEREVDSFIGRELELKNYLSAMDVGTKRRNDVRKSILRFLEESDAVLDRHKIPAAGQASIRADRGPIHWLERAQAEALAGKLPLYWSQLFRVNVGLGLRPEEVPTLHRDNFSDSEKLVTLAPRDGWTLKTGSRKIIVTPAVRAIVRARLAESPILFPQVVYATEKAPTGRWSAGRPRVVSGHMWKTADWFCRCYVRQLRAAAAAVNADEKIKEAAKIRFKLDARIARRTCGSLLIRSGWSAEQVAAVLGNDARMVREHYARILSGEMVPSAAAI